MSGFSGASWKEIHSGALIFSNDPAGRKWRKADYMSIPDSVPKTSAGYIKYLEDKVNEAEHQWNHYWLATSHAYTKAYDGQVAVLNQIKKVFDAREQFGKELLAFGLSLLTVGTAGGVAGAVARGFFPKDASGSRNEVGVDIVKDVLKKVMTTSGDKGIAALSPKAPADDVFSPGGVNPTEYLTALGEGISYYSGLLIQILNTVKYDRSIRSAEFDGKVIPLTSAGDQLTAADAKYLTESILNSSYVSEAPPLKLDSNKLLPMATLALWIGWAYARDVAYWSAAPKTYELFSGMKGVRYADRTYRAYHEQFDWDPVRITLRNLGVPEPRITATNLYRNNGISNTGLYMRGFMEWVNMDAKGLLFKDKDLQHAKGYELVKDRMSHKVLGPISWMDA